MVDTAAGGQAQQHGSSWGYLSKQAARRFHVGMNPKLVPFRSTQPWSTTPVGQEDSMRSWKAANASGVRNCPPAPTA